MCLLKPVENEDSCNHPECNAMKSSSKVSCFHARMNQNNAFLGKRTQPNQSIEEMQKDIQEFMTKQRMQQPPNAVQDTIGTQVIQFPLNLPVMNLNMNSHYNLPNQLPKQNVGLNQQIPNLLQEQTINILNMAQQQSTINAPKFATVPYGVQCFDFQMPPSQMDCSGQSGCPVCPEKCNGVNRVVHQQVVQLLGNQSKMLNDLQKKNQILQETVSNLLKDVMSFKSQMGQKPVQTSQSLNPMLASNVNSSKICTKEELIEHLYGKECGFKYQISLEQEFPLPLYRERNFSFKVCIKDMNGNKVENNNNIEVGMALYTSENPPKYVDTNTSGNKILKGFTERNIIKGVASFEKIQIKEVTSHFRNGWIYIVIYPKLKTIQNMFNCSQNGFIDPSMIKPLVVEKVLVKAKKIKLHSSSKKKGDESSEEIYS